MISGKQIALVNMEMAHVPLVYGLYLSGKYDRYFLNSHVTMDEIGRGKDNIYVIVNKNDPRVPIGICSYKVECESSRRVLISTCIDEGFQKNGIGKEATILMLWDLFNNKNFYKAKAIVRSDNEGSIKGCQSIGFFQAGKLKDEFFMKGQFWDAFLFEITKRAFNEKHKEAVGE